MGSRVEQEAHDRDVVVSYQPKGWYDKPESVISIERVWALYIPCMQEAGAQGDIAFLQLLRLALVF